MLTEFSGKTAVITGAASGIGLALAQKALKVGMNVVAADIDRAGLERLSAAQGAGVATMVVDVADESQVEALADLAYGRFGSVSLLCNNAGISTSGSVWSIDPEVWRWTMGVNFMGIVHGLRQFMPRMLTGGEPGAIVNTGSMASLGSAPGLGAYCAAKHAVLGLSEALLYDLQAVEAPISVSLLCPGAVRTGIMSVDRTPSGETGHDPRTQRKLTRMIDEGISPDVVADMVFDHVAKGKFWIFTQPEMLAGANKRYKGMIDSVAHGGNA